MRIPERKVSFSVSVIDKLLTEITKVWSGYQDKSRERHFGPQIGSVALFQSKKL